jgi:phage-related protein
MPLDIYAAAILEKNKLSSSEPHIALVQITLTRGSSAGFVLRLCLNNENITWNGYTWVAFPFEIDTFGEQKAEELPKVILRVGNASRVISYYLERSEGGIDAEVIIRVVHNAHLDQITPIIELYYSCISSNTTPDGKWAIFNLGAPNAFRKKVPRDRLMKRYCRFKVFKGSLCKYVGLATTCDRTYEQCRSYGNLNNFGGAPGLGSGGLRI